jgi:hypothetical protein
MAVGLKTRPSITMTSRQCPVCLSVGTLSPSHRRDSQEAFLAVVAPFVLPFRCSACNWRGLMGRISFVRHRKINNAINFAIYYSVLLVVIQFYIHFREGLLAS